MSISTEQIQTLTDAITFAKNNMESCFPQKNEEEMIFLQAAFEIGRDFRTLGYSDGDLKEHMEAVKERGGYYSINDILGKNLIEFLEKAYDFLK